MSQEASSVIPSLSVIALIDDIFSNGSMTFDLTTVSEVTSTTESKLGLVSDDAIWYVNTISYALCSVLCVFGIITNIINIIVFVKMKFKETINIALLGLAIGDLLSIVPLFWVAICFNPWFLDADLPFYPEDVQLKTGGYTHNVFTRVTSFLTVYITFERCLCIAFPLKIKRILTPRRVMIIIVIIYIFTIGTLCQNFFTVRFAKKFDSDRNKTAVGMVYNDYNRDIIQAITYPLNATYIVISFVGVSVCSAVLIWKLNERKRWLTSVASEQDKSKDLRDRQVIKMVVFVAVIFIVNFTPPLIYYMAITTIPELNMGKKFENMFIIITSLNFIFDAINSAVNIFVYYKMSSKYARVFRTLFGIEQEKAVN